MNATTETGRPIPIQSSSKRILVVDDNPTVRSALRRFIESYTRVQVWEAVDGAQAVEQAEAKKPDIIIMDLVMPNMNGIEAASVIRSRLPDTHVVVFTLHSDVIGEQLARAIGVDTVVSKADGATGLIKALQPMWASNFPS